MKAAGVQSNLRVFTGVTHEFFGMGSVVRGAAQANAWAVSRLAPALGVRGR